MVAFCWISFFYLYLNSDNVTQPFLVYQNKFFSKCIIFRKKNYENKLKNWNRRWKIIVKNMCYHCKSSAIISRFMQMIWRLYLWSASKWKKTDYLHSKALFTPCTEHWILYKIRGKVLCFYSSLPLKLKVKWSLLLFQEKKSSSGFFFSSFALACHKSIRNSTIPSTTLTMKRTWSGGRKTMEPLWHSMCHSLLYACTFTLRLEWYF